MPFSHCVYQATLEVVVFIVQLSTTSRLSIDYGKQPLLFLSFNYPQRDVWPLFILSNPLLFLSSNYPQRAVYIVYLKQPLLFYRSIILKVTFTLFTLSNLCCFYRSIILNATFGHCIYKATFFYRSIILKRAVYIVYMNQPLLFSSFNYHQRVVYPLIMVSNHCCFYRSIILNATFGDCL